MGWLEDAEKRIKELQKGNQESEEKTGIYNLADKEQKEKLKKALKLEYLEASELNINKAIEEAAGKFEKPYDEAEIKKFFRKKLEY